MNSIGGRIMSQRQGVAILGAVTLGVVVGVFFLPPIAQDPGYHEFADHRFLIGIPNFANLISNAPFVLVGLLGLGLLQRCGRDTSRFAHPGERIPFAIIFSGLVLVGLGSGYYHWSPSHFTMVWDRLPIALTTMAVVAMMVAERNRVRIGLQLLPFLLLIGGGSVFYWHFTEAAGHGDLRPYGLVLFYPYLAVFLMLFLFPPRYTGTKHIAALLAWSVASRIMELFDVEVFQASGGFVSGHTLKHFFAAIGCYELVRYIRNRRRV
jgi:hypothetical protein